MEFSAVFCRVVTREASPDLIEVALSEVSGLAGPGGLGFTLACQPNFLGALLDGMRYFPRHVQVQRSGCGALEALSKKIQVGGAGFAAELAREHAAASEEYAALAKALAIDASTEEKWQSWIGDKAQLATRQRLLGAGATAILEAAAECPGLPPIHARRALDYLIFGVRKTNMHVESATIDNDYHSILPFPVPIAQDVISKALKNDGFIPWTLSWSAWWGKNFRSWCHTVGLQLLEFRDQTGHGGLCFQILTHGECPLQTGGKWKNGGTWRLLKPINESFGDAAAVTRSLAALQLGRPTRKGGGINGGIEKSGGGGEEGAV